MTRLLLLALYLTTTGCFTALSSISLSGPSCRDTAGFVGTRDRDTVVLEVAEMTHNRLRDYAFAQGRQTVYHASIDSALVLVQGTFYVWSLADSVKPIEDGLYELDGDTVWVGAHRLEHFDLQHAAVGRGASILPPGAIGYEELLTRRARITGKDSVDIPTFSLVQGDARMAHIRFIGADSARIQYGDGHVLADLRVDPAGRILRAHFRDASGRPVHVDRVGCGVAEALIGERYRVYNAWFRADPATDRRKADH